MAERPLTPPAKPGSARRRKGLRRGSFGWMLVPAVAVYLVFIAYPFVTGIRYSFFNWQGVGPLTDFIGLANYRFIFSASGFWPFVSRVIVHSMYFFVLSFILSVIFGLLLAFMLYNINARLSKFLQVLYFVPYVIPPIVVAYIWSMYLEPNFGLLSTLFNNMGLPFLNIPFLGEPGLALPTIVAIGTWAGLGFPVLIFLAALMNVPGDILDAARVDGCGPWTTLVRIIFPLLQPTFMTVVTLTWIGSFSVFDIVYILEGTQAGPNYATDVMGTLFYRTAFGGFGATAQSMSLATAVAVIGFIFVMGISAGFVWLQRRVTIEY